MIRCMDNRAMKKNKLVYLCLISLVLSSCSNEEKLKLVFDSYKNYDKALVLQNFGRPQKSYLENNNTILEYNLKEESFRVSEDIAPAPFDIFRINQNTNSKSNTNNVSIGTGSVQANYSSSECRLVFTAGSNNLIQDWHYQGVLCDEYANKNFVNKRFIQDLTSKGIDSYGIILEKNSKGKKVSEVFPNSSAAKLGLSKGDIILKINDVNTAPLATEIAYQELNKQPKASLVILKGKTESTIVVTKSSIPLLYQFKESQRKFLGFKQD